MIVYIGNPIVSTKNLLNLISEFGKITGCKVNIQKSTAFLYTNNEIPQREPRGKKPIYYSSKKNKVRKNKLNQKTCTQITVEH